MSFFAYHNIETMSLEMGGPKRRSLFNSEAVFDASVIDMIIKHMIDYAAALGACRPRLALQILATVYKNRDWEGKDAPQILDFINKSKQRWKEKKDLAPHDIIKFSSFSEHEELVSVKTLHNKEIQSGMEQKFVEGLLWGLTNSNEFKSWYEIDRKEKESHIPEYKSAGLNVRQFPELSEYLQECEKMVGEYVKKMGSLSPIPQKLLDDVRELSLEVKLN